MLWERTLLNNFIGEPDAPIKSAEAYLSVLIFQMLYAMVSLPLMIRMCFRSIIFHTEIRGTCSEIVSKPPGEFGVFCNDFFALSL
ncbi:hypothetical protein V202x_07520 [Gimesia aquarii]|uniref:Uncharacterized protein n=1 Tax=Gimesia aquarii TaxID=2527964 RepID=A0A517WQ67_9PLAN|nr:hypothetical protein V202x_07520 [Gimesia aquarii]